MGRGKEAKAEMKVVSEWGGDVVKPVNRLFNWLSLLLYYDASFLLHYVANLGKDDICA